MTIKDPKFYKLKDPEAFVVMLNRESLTVQIAKLLNVSIEQTILCPAAIRGELGSLKCVDLAYLTDKLNYVGPVTDEELVAILEESGQLE